MSGPLSSSEETCPQTNWAGFFLCFVYLIAICKTEWDFIFSEMNAESSRSHLILGIVIESTNLTSGAVVKGKVSNDPDWDFLLFRQVGAEYIATLIGLTRRSKFHSDQHLNSSSPKFSGLNNHMQCVPTNQNEGASFRSIRWKTSLPCLAAGICFPALATCGVIFRAWQQPYDFPRLQSVTFFPALGIVYMFFLLR